MAKLEELGNSDFEIIDGEPDIIGWNVFDRAGEKIGEVTELLFDPEARAVRYVIMVLQAHGEESDDDKLIPVPIGVAELHGENDGVLLPVASAEELADLPVYQCGALTPEQEARIRQAFEGSSTAPYQDPEFYAHEHFNEDKFYRRGKLPDNMDRAARVSRIMERINRKDQADPNTSSQPENI